jgi:hypothetical protein
VVTVAVRVEQDTHATTVFAPLEVPGRGRIWVEVDMGSDSLILDVGLAGALGVDIGAESTRRVDDRDETGHAYSRYFATLAGVVTITGHPNLCQTDPSVMFQEIIYDGLVGNDFLSRFVVTYDLANARMIFAATG